MGAADVILVGCFLRSFGRSQFTVNIFCFFLKNFVVDFVFSWRVLCWSFAKTRHFLGAPRIGPIIRSKNFAKQPSKPQTDLWLWA